MIPGTTRACVLVLLASCASIGCRESRGVQIPEENRLLEELMESYVTERFRFYPVESTLSGLPGNDARIGSFGRADIDGRVAWLDDFHHRLMGLRLTELSQLAYLDALWLTSLTKAELYELEERRRWARTASFYADHMRLGLVTLLAEGDLSARANALAGRLESIPRLMSQARENLAAAGSVWRRDGLDSLEKSRRLLSDLPQMLESRLPSHRVAELAQLSRLATRAVQDLMESLPVGEEGDASVPLAAGRGGLQRFFFHRHMLDKPIEALELEANDALDLATHELTALALELHPSMPLERALTLEPIRLPPEEAVREAEKRVIAFLRDRDGAASPDTSIPVRLVPDHFPGREPVRLWRPKALEPARGAFLMVRSTTALDRSALELLTLREAGGRARQFARQAESASLLRRVVTDDATSAGWLATFERDALDGGYESARSMLRLRHRHRTTIAMLRLVAVIEFHANGKSLDEMSALFEERGYLSPEAARAEAERVAVDLGVASSGLGQLLVHELREDYFGLHPLSPRSELEARLLEEGLPPVGLIRFRLLPADSFH